MRVQFSTALAIAQKRNLRVLPTLAVAIAEALRGAGYVGPLPRAVRNPDLPSGLVIRCCRLEAPPRYLVEAREASVCRCGCSVEAGIPGAWCAPLPSADRRRRLYRRIVALPHVVRSREEQRCKALESWNASSARKEGT